MNNKDMELDRLAVVVVRTYRSLLLCSNAPSIPAALARGLQQHAIRGCKYTIVCGQQHKQPHSMHRDEVS